MATTPSPYPAFPSATTYPPHPYGCYYPPPIPYPHQIHHHHPFPFGFPSAYAPGPPGPVFFQPPPAQTATTAFSYAATYPYSPPASAYTAASSAPTAPAYGPSSFSSAAAIPSTAVPPAPTQEHLQPPPPTGALSLSATTETALLHHPEQVPSAHLTSGRSSPTTRLLDPIPTTIGLFPYESPCLTSEPIPIHTKAEPNWPPPAPDPTTSTSPCCWPSSTTTPVPPPHPATARQAAPPSWSADLAQQLKLAHRSLLNINRRLDEYAESQRSVASLQGKLYKLADRLATPRVSSSASVPSMFSNTSAAASYLSSPFDPCFVVPAPSLPSVSATSEATRASIVPSVSAAVASKVFDEKPTPSSGYENFSGHPIQSSCVQSGSTNLSEQLLAEMPSPNSWQETHGTVPDYGSGHQNPIQSSCLSNLSEQNLGGMPQSYGFSNLNRQSIILADGTERSYFTLPADYPLKQATPQMSPSAAANIAVTAQLPVEANEACLTAFCCSKTNSIADSETMLVHDVQPPTAVQDNHKEQNDEKAVGNVQQLRDSHWNVLVIPVRRREWDPGEHTNLSSTLNKDVFGVLIRVLQQSCYYRVPSGQENHSIQFLWDPGILSLMDIMLSQTMVPSLMDLKQLWAQLLLQCHFWYTSLNAFLQVRDSWLPIVLDCLYSESLKKQVHYSIMFSLLAMCMSTATSVRMGLVLWFGKIAQEEKDTAAVYQVLKIQSMRKTSHIWDPVIESIKFFNNGLHVHKIQLVHCFAIHACYLIHAVLPHAQITANSLSNIEAGEVTSRCLGFHLHQINNWTSTTSSAFASFQYAYTIDFVNGQFEFFNQQVAQRNYSAQHLLLFSQQYIKIREIGTFFITFLPP